MASLVPSAQPHDQDFDTLCSHASALEATLAERAAGLDRVKAELAAFATRYRQQVGELHQELEDVELAIAEAELGEIGKRLEREASSGPASAGVRPEGPPRYTSDAVRRLFRDVAKAIHPDLADGEPARDRRHRLMIEANRAYALGDEERLRWILQAWETSPEAVQGTDPEATRQRLLRRIAQLQDQIAQCDRDRAVLSDTPLWKLKAMVDGAATRGSDLVADTVRRLKRDIMVARNRLDALQSAR